MISKVTSFLEEHHMIEKDDLVAAGVSGGADSLCLLFMLLEYQRKVPFDLVVVHVNHKIRKEAAQDAKLVEELCKKENLPYYLVEKDVKKIAKTHHLSEEEAGRKVRYEAFEEALELYDREGIRKKKIAVAHHQGDSAETLLFHLFRGSGIYGMSGILPVNGKIIRPLLTCSRTEIEDYLIKKGQIWCMDSTNEEDTYTRNKIRHHILQFADRNINDKATTHVARTALQMTTLRNYLETEVKKMVSKVAVIEENSISTRLDIVAEYHLFLQEQYWLWAISYLASGRKDITERHIKALQELAQKEGSKQLDLPHNLMAVKEYKMLRIYVRDKKEKSAQDEILKDHDFILPKEEGIYPLFDGRSLEISYITLEQLGTIEENKYTKYFDYDKINTCLKVRFRQTGDYLTINNEGQKKSLKEYFIGEKIPKNRRDEIPLIADENHILWVIGYRISSYYKVTNETEKIMKMTIRRDEKWQKQSAFY